MRKNLKPVIHQDLKPLRHQGRIINGYFVSLDGKIYSNKRGKLKEKKLQQYKEPKALQYPHTTVWENGKSICVRIHRALGEAFLPFPRPKEIPYKIWLKTSIIVKRLLQQNYIIDHIDNDPLNYRLSNLRWASTKENSVNYHTVQKYLK